MDPNDHGIAKLFCISLIKTKSCKITSFTHASVQDPYDIASVPLRAMNIITYSVRTECRELNSPECFY